MNDDDFDALLRSSERRVSLPPTFRHEVWRKIETSSAPTRFGIVQAFFAFISKPKCALAGLAVMVAIGMTLGAVSVPKEATAEIAYANSISPFAQAHR